MNSLASILITTIVAWLAHVGLVTTYMKLFADTHSLKFRLVYALEISSVMAIAFGLYFIRSSQPISLTAVLVTVLSFLTIVDILIFSFSKTARTTFDVGHFIVAYAIVVLAITITHKVFAQN